MAFYSGGYTSGTGSQSGSIDKNFHLAQHNDRVFALAKMHPTYEGFLNFTAKDTTCIGKQSVAEIIRERKTVHRSDLRFFLSHFLTDSIVYSDKSTDIMD